jgi:hypothetical protein
MLPATRPCSPISRRVIMARELDVLVPPTEEPTYRCPAAARWSTIAEWMMYWGITSTSCDSNIRQRGSTCRHTRRALRRTRPRRLTQRTSVDRRTARPAHPTKRGCGDTGTDHSAAATRCCLSLRPLDRLFFGLVAEPVAARFARLRARLGRVLRPKSPADGRSARLHG